MILAITGVHVKVPDECYMTMHKATRQLRELVIRYFDKFNEAIERRRRFAYGSCGPYPPPQVMQMENRLTRPEGIT